MLGKGHGTEALGPSDTTDSGSDLQGAGGGAAHAPGGITPTGRAVGDADLDSDTDATGTGEREPRPSMPIARHSAIMPARRLRRAISGLMVAAFIPTPRS